MENLYDVDYPKYSRIVLSKEVCLHHVTQPLYVYVSSDAMICNVKFLSFMVASNVPITSLR